MSQSATLYRISQAIFTQLESPNDKPKFEINTAKSYVTFQGSFMGLEYVLSKGQDVSTTALVSEIFNPTQSLGGQEFESLTPEEQFEFYESGLFIPYLDTLIISKLNDFISNVSQTDISSKYDAEELNENRIYPEVWHNDNSADKAYNERHILEGLEELKKIIREANMENDYILVFIG